MTTNTQAQPQAGALSTGALVGVRLAQALGWRVGAGALLFFACPLASAGGWFLSYTAKCVDVTKLGRDGSYQLCANYGAEHLFGAVGLALAALLILGAVGLWKRGGAVRDVELLEERVERPAQRPSSAPVTIDGQLAK